jgi:hypothetical protein
VARHAARRRHLRRRGGPAGGSGRVELAALVRDVVAEQIALLLGVPPDEITL